VPSGSSGRNAGVDAMEPPPLDGRIRPVSTISSHPYYLYNAPPSPAAMVPARHTRERHDMGKKTA
jgi:hypothetical protein